MQRILFHFPDFFLAPPAFNEAIYASKYLCILSSMTNSTKLSTSCRRWPFSLRIGASLMDNLVIVQARGTHLFISFMTSAQRAMAFSLSSTIASIRPIDKYITQLTRQTPIEKFFIISYSANRFCVFSLSQIFKGVFGLSHSLFSFSKNQKKYCDLVISNMQHLLTWHQQQNKVCR